MPGESLHVAPQFLENPPKNQGTILRPSWWESIARAMEFRTPDGLWAADSLITDIGWTVLTGAVTSPSQIRSFLQISLRAPIVWRLRGNSTADSIKTILCLRKARS